MIVYNIRANGPWEYDKFILNATQLHNEAKVLEKSDLLDEIKQKIEEYDIRLQKFTNEKTSPMNEIMLRDLKERGMIVGY